MEIKIEQKPIPSSTSSSSSSSSPLDSNGNSGGGGSGTDSGGNGGGGGGGGASQFLLNLPSRGLFSSNVASSNLGGMRVYLCDRDTSPPEKQIITTNQTNILIRSLTLKKQNNDSNLKGARSKANTEHAKGKRSAERMVDGRASAKKATLSKSRNSQQEGSSGGTIEKGFQFQGLTVEKLRALLKQRGLPTRGKKDELISRLKKDSIDGGEA